MSWTNSLAVGEVDDPTISFGVKLPSLLASYTTKRSKSLLSSAVERVSRDAWFSVMFFLIVAELGSLGSSWWPTSAMTLRWLSPKPSAFSPGSSMLDSNVTSKPPVSEPVESATDDGVTLALPRVTEYGVWKASPCQLTSCKATAWRPSWAGAVTTSSAPPVAVLKRHTPAPTLVLGLPPTVLMMYGAPNTESGNTWNRFAERPMIRVSRSVNGAVPSHVVSARKSEPSAGRCGTSR